MRGHHSTKPGASLSAAGPGAVPRRSFRESSGIVWLDRLVARLLGCFAVAAVVVGGEALVWSFAAGRGRAIGIVLLAGILVAAPVLGGTVITALLERRSVLAYGLRASNPLRMVICGAAWGTALAAGFVTALIATGHMTIEGPTLTFGDAVRLAAVTVAYFLLFAFTEALCFQGLVLTVASRYTGPALGSLIAAVAFASAHVSLPGLGAVGIATLAVAGFGFALIARMTGSIWWNVGFLAAFDWVQLVLYGNPPLPRTPHLQLFVASTFAGDEAITGGRYGIEASVLMLPVALVTVAALLFIGRKRNPLRGLLGAARTAVTAALRAG
jgi:uncharacterized protein